MPENRLKNASSPYLLQHKNNPVHWWEWGPEAMAEAKRTGKPILLSVGYSACHWCHVMAHESFEDNETAKLMNDLYINIKVDREERPDVDLVYMRALHALGEQGGWPLTMFLTPEAEPVWGGTYFPKEARYGRPSFKQVLGAVANTFANDHDTIETNRQSLLMVLNERPKQPSTIDQALVSAAGERLSSMIDRELGGIRGAPKFPQASVMELILRTGYRDHNKDLIDLHAESLRMMSQGGIYDHVGGGLARYSVDENWLVPHFEKMLYDNAQYIDHLCWAYCHTQDPLFIRRLSETVDWIEREMLLPEGGVSAALDADSEGVEGKFYVWTDEELSNLLPEDSIELFRAVYDVQPQGNWEGTTILNRSRPLPRPLTEEEESQLSSCLALLLEERTKRIRPHRDDKVLLDWNAMLISALAHGYQIVSRESLKTQLRTLAHRIFEFIETHMRETDGSMIHSIRDGVKGPAAFAGDYAHLARAALALSRIEDDPEKKDSLLATAKSLLDQLDVRYAHPQGGYYMTSESTDDLLVRPYHAMDEATPNYNAVAANALVEYWMLTDEAAYRERADQLIATFTGEIRANIFGTAALLNALDTRTRFKKAEITLSPDRETNQVSAAWKSGDPAWFTTVTTKPDAAASEVLICSENGCSVPLLTAEAIEEEMQRIS